MSLTLAALLVADKRKNLSREKILALRQDPTYLDGRTKQAFADETDINKIMARFDQTGTISHLAKHEGSYSDYSDFDFHGYLNKISAGQAIFADLSAEIRREFRQDPAAFFEYVNDPANAGDLRNKLPGLAAPGTQLPRTVSPDADLEAADAAANTPTLPIKEEK